MVVGAVLEFAPIDVHAMALMGAIAFQSFNDEPERASRPYDTRREGFVPAHGGATLVLEERDAAKRRGARIYAEVLGCAANSDGNHLPQPSEDGQAQVMAPACSRDAGLRPPDVDYVNAHATSTPLGDLTELRSIKRVFGDHASRLSDQRAEVDARPLLLVGADRRDRGRPAADAGRAPAPVDQHRRARPRGRSRRVPRRSRSISRVSVMLKNSFGFGGINCVSLWRNHEG